MKNNGLMIKCKINDEQTALVAEFIASLLRQDCDQWFCQFETSLNTLASVKRLLKKICQQDLRFRLDKSLANKLQMESDYYLNCIPRENFISTAVTEMITFINHFNQFNLITLQSYKLNIVNKTRLYCYNDKMPVEVNHQSRGMILNKNEDYSTAMIKSAVITKPVIVINEK